MSGAPFAGVLTHDAPGEFRATIVDAKNQAVGLFIQRWSGVGDRARFGDVARARIRMFADHTAGAFLELTSGEEAFLNLKSRTGLTEGAIVSVEIRSEARHGKLARVSLTERGADGRTPFDRWRETFPGVRKFTPVEDEDTVSAAFNDAAFKSVVLPGGGQMHVDRTRALTAFDIDTAGRISSGSAGARALSINREAAIEMARQASLRGIGGNLVLDCLAPLNAASKDVIREKAKDAFSRLGLAGAKVLKPSPLGLLEVAIPWRFMPIEDQLNANAGETALLTLLSALQREAKATPTALYNLSLGGAVRQAYLARKTEVGHAMEHHFGARVIVVQSADSKSEFIRR